MIDRYHLRYFLAVIDRGNFSKAAAACNVSQPTLSVGIAKLESSLGAELFYRTNRRVELTAAGAQLAAHARGIEASFARAQRAVAGAEAPKTLRLGVLVTLPAVWIEAFLRHRQSSGVPDRLEIVEGRERELNDRLARGRIDVALTILRERGGEGQSDTIFSEGYGIAMAVGHPLADQSIIQAQELMNEPMLVRRQCELLPDTSRFFTARGVRPFFPARTVSDERALGYVRAGLGVTIMPNCFVSPGVARVQLDDFTFIRDIGLSYAPHVDADEMRRSPLVRSSIGSIEAQHEALIA